VSTTAKSNSRIERISPTEVEAGDLIIDGSTSLRVLSEPYSMHKGLGLFDDFQMMIRAEVEDTEDGHRSARVWGLDTVLVRHLPPRTNHDDA
jgi:hypothetical protein